MTLRWGVIGAFMLLFAWILATGVAHHHFPRLIAPLVWLAVLLIILILERPRYAPKHRDVPEAFAPNGERFIDPTTGQEISVYANAAGVREYRPSQKSP